MAPPVNYFDIFQGQTGLWYWALYEGSTDSILATSSEGYLARGSCVDDVIWFQDSVDNAYVPTDHDADEADGPIEDKSDSDEEPMERDSD